MYANSHMHLSINDSGGFVRSYRAHHKTNSAFLPLVDIFLHCDHCCNSVTLSIFRSLATSKRGTRSILLTSIHHWIDFETWCSVIHFKFLFKINVHAPCTININVLIFQYETVPWIYLKPSKYCITKWWFQQPSRSHDKMYSWLWRSLLFHYRIHILSR